MAANGTTGQKWILSMKATGVATYTPLGFMRSKNLTRTRQTIDASSDQNPDWVCVVTGQRSWNIDGEMIDIYNDAGQILLDAAFASDDVYDFKLSTGVTGEQEFLGEGLTTEDSFQIATNQVVTRRVTIQGVGTLTKQAVP